MRGRKTASNATDARAESAENQGAAHARVVPRWPRPPPFPALPERPAQWQRTAPAVACPSAPALALSRVRPDLRTARRDPVRAATRRGAALRAAADDLGACLRPVCADARCPGLCGYRRRRAAGCAVRQRGGGVRAVAQRRAWLLLVPGGQDRCTGRVAWPPRRDRRHADRVTPSASVQPHVKPAGRASHAQSRIGASRVPHPAARLDTRRGGAGSPPRSAVPAVTAPFRRPQGCAMSFRSTPLLLATSFAAAGLALAGTASAHGTMTTPVSRVYACFQGNPENPTNPACAAAKAVGGAQACYDWNGINQANANGNHQAVVPDGKLCSGNNPTFRGLDLDRSDWQTTPIQPDANGKFTFVFKATAPHATRDWRFFVTRDGWQPGSPLRWADLQDARCRSAAAST
ncbi:hypothetical protein G6F65_015815 [Rhizopus arrhizus]|nr:hypothetical protein G6F65_015815 [Rhizopus arrhizus]